MKAVRCGKWIAGGFFIGASDTIGHDFVAFVQVAADDLDIAAVVESADDFDWPRVTAIENKYARRMLARSRFG